ncbi:MAG TPA: glycosyltransferase family 4 protein [Steroidobacteraceae bacterium]|nr:glycosyltransferase family 4 protein [Steroidobacteraceae bacterium]
MATLLSINNYYYYRGGAETVFLEHNRLFEAQDWRVVPFAMRHPQNLPTPWSRYFVEEIEFGVQYSLGQKLTRLPKTIYSLEARRNLRALLDIARPDVCHAHNIYHHLSPSILGLLKSRGVPTVLTLHDLKIACPAYTMLARDGICERCRQGRLYNVLLHRCIKGSAALSAVAMIEATLHRLIGSYRNCVDRFIVPSRFFIEKLAQWGFHESLFAHVPNFVDAARYQPRYEPGPAFVYFGRLSREKGLVTLIRAAARGRCPVVIVGSGPQLDELRALALELRADATFVGYLRGAALHEVIRNARAVVMPSECYENAPMGVLEAYALGKPVIGARIGGIPELIRAGVTGRGFTSGDVESLAEALREFADRSDPELRNMGVNARRWVEEEFSAQLYRERINDVYSQVGVSTDRRGTPACEHAMHSEGS